MKRFMQNFRMINLIFAIIMSTFLTIKAQVITRVLSPNDKIENYIPWYSPNKRIPIVKTPFVDVDAVLEQDKMTNREMPRIGIKQNVNYTTKDGELIKHDNYLLWNMTIQSENAKSISIRFDNTTLPKEAIMYLYNEETRFVVGPITNKNFFNKTFLSDYFDGDIAKITVFIPNEIEQTEFLINIINIFYGLESDEIYDDDFGSSGTCNVNVTCDEGNGWECQINSVCKIIIQESSCSGALINNDCCDLSPYILTANHCFTISGINPTDWNFRFNYESPVCTPSEEPYPSQWVTYYGANINARWEDTDFLLLELHNPLNQESSLSFSGWDRTPQMPPNSTYIHHPSGDIKKISFDAGASTIQGGFYRFELTPNANGDFGTLEGGSSGCPKYNPDRRIIGQQHGGIPWRILCNTSESDNEDGRFDISWEGNGTNTTRLRNWLGASTNPNTMDCMENPYINGPDILCTTPEIYTLINNMPCTKNVTWAVEPTSLFASATSGNGNVATLWGGFNQNGSATITYTLTSNGCNPVRIEKDIWVGNPDFDIYGETELCIGDRGEAFLFFNSPVNAANIQWNFYGAVSGYGGTVKARYRANYEGAGWVCASITNECGTTEKCLLVWVEDCNGGWGKGKGYRNTSNDSNADKKLDIFTDTRLVIYPNPTNNFVNINILNADKTLKRKIQILDTNGKVIKSISTNDNLLEIDISNHPTGLYFIQCTIGDKIIHNKFLKL